jgi:hypothetical protein
MKTDTNNEDLYLIKRYKSHKHMTQDALVEHNRQLRKDRNRRYYNNKKIAEKYGKEYIPKLHKKHYEFTTIPVSSVIDIVKPEETDEIADDFTEGSITEHYELLLDLYDLGDTQFDPEIKILEDYFCIC